jgi:hypothetical protein
VDVVKNELKKIWKEAAVDVRYYPGMSGGNEENCEKHVPEYSVCQPRSE